jgi:hypothetical protein
MCDYICMFMYDGLALSRGLGDYVAHSAGIYMHIIYVYICKIIYSCICTCIHNDLAMSRSF